MKKNFLKVLLCLFVALFTISLASCGEEVHDLGELHERLEASFFNDGHISYYECSKCITKIF